MKKNFTLFLILCSILIHGQANLGDYKIYNLDINTELSDFGTNFFGDDKIIFSAPRENRLVKLIWDGNKQPFLDLYSGEISSDGEIINKTKIKGKVNSSLHEAGICFTKDLKTVYFTANNLLFNRKIKDTLNNINLQLYKAEINTKGDWINIERLPFNDDNFSTGHPALSVDNKILYFISDRPGSVGETDIYKVDILNNGSYSAPSNIGEAINTKGKEMFPFVDKDGVLYFSSDGYNGMGKLDVFASKIYRNGFSQPVNLGNPVNSAEDDFAFIIKANKGYFSSNRTGGKGDDDIYFFTASKEIEFICKTKIFGQVKSKESGKLITDATVELLDSDGNTLKVIKTDATLAKYNFDILCGKDYQIKAYKTGFIEDINSSYIVYSSGEEAIEKDLFLIEEFKMIGNDKYINLNPIYFDFDKWNIRPDAALELNKVVEIMKKYPDIIIHGSSHTDARGSKSYNKKLSKKRALATKEYIISKGIDKNRIDVKGYGESKLINNCDDFNQCSEERHQENRRTEFKVLKFEE